MNRGAEPVREPTVVHRWYRATPLHLVVALGGLGLAGHAALAAATDPVASAQWRWMALWFAAAIVAHDLVLFPGYAAADRLLVAGFAGSVNFVRVPLLGCVLTFGLFFPGIVRQGEPAVLAATGLDQQPYLARWLALCAGMFAVSALALLLREALGGARRRCRLGTDLAASPPVERPTAAAAR